MISETFITNDPAREVVTLSDHLVRFPESEWGVWRWVAVRGAGFPATEVLKLAAPPTCVALADQLLQAEEEAQRARREAIRHMQSALENEHDESRRSIVRKILRRLREGKTLRPSDVSAVDRVVLDFLRLADASVESAREQYQSAFEDAITHVSQGLYDIAGSDKFREALIWQNRDAYQRNITSFLQHKPGVTFRNSDRRRREELIASYLQRYAVKNDTIGFFGPVGWARIVDTGPALEMKPGPGMLASRRVYFESWCIDALAEVLNQSKAFRPWATPRLLPYFSIEGQQLYGVSETPLALSADVATVLQECDGARSAYDIAAELSSSTSSQVKTKEDVYAILEDVTNQGLIVWTYECVLGPGAEDDLRRQVERITDKHLQAQALEALDEMTRARNAVADGAGKPEELDAALATLETSFTRLTGKTPLRREGLMYAGRTLVYEDCRRDLEVNIGPELVQQLAAPLSLLLTSARWATFEIAQTYRRIFRSIYDELVDRGRSPVVDGVRFFRKAQSSLWNEFEEVIKPVQSKLQERWESVLTLDWQQRRVALHSRDLVPLVESTFAAPAAGWRLARYHSPDVMIAARSVEDIRRGNCQFVLGELHLGGNTLIASFFVEQHPAPEELFAAAECDLPEPCVVPITPKDLDGATTRTSLSLVPEKDYRLALSYDACGFAPSRTLPLGSLVVEDSSGQLLARTRDGRLQFDLLELFGGGLSLATVGYFRLFGPRPHTPRVTIDNLVVQRESWRFEAMELGWACEKAQVERFAGARRWARAHELPRFCFVKVATERKPLFVDMESPALLQVLVKALRQAAAGDAAKAEVAITEMLPGLEEAWLADAEGQRYTSEFRMVTFDMKS